MHNGILEIAIGDLKSSTSTLLLEIGDELLHNLALAYGIDLMPYAAARTVSLVVPILRGSSKRNS